MLLHGKFCLNGCNSSLRRPPCVWLNQDLNRDESPMFLTHLTYCCLFYTINHLNTVSVLWMFEIIILTSKPKLHTRSIKVSTGHKAVISQYYNVGKICYLFPAHYSTHRMPAQCGTVTTSVKWYNITCYMNMKLQLQITFDLLIIYRRLWMEICIYRIKALHSLIS